MTRRLHLTAVLLLTLLVASCHKEAPEVEFSISVPAIVLDGDKGTQFVKVTAADSGQWTLTLSGEDGGAVDWAEVDPASGTGTKSSVTITWQRNDTGAKRTMILSGKCGSQKAEVTITQDVYENQPGGGGGGALPETIVADPVPKWMELPATNDKSLYFITHDSSYNKCGRNYSFYWDVEALVAHWVAYPLNSSLAGSGSRTDAWDLDPKLPRSAQPVLYSGYRGGYSSSGNVNGGSTWYDRGHQCPSADRLNYSDNVQTFYGTNMTPQDPTLNQNIWASLEQYVRDRSRKFDTLYVVTGCVVEGSTSYAYDNEGKKVTAPVGYYKALLGYQKSPAVGITAQTHGYTGVAFYFENRAYSGNNYKANAMTIDELEAKTGVDFFVNLPAAIGSDLAGKVESTKDNYWYN